MNIKPLPLLTALLAASLLIGCASSNPRRDAANDVINRTEKFRQAVEASKEQVGVSLAAMERLPGSGTELKKAYNNFQGEVKAMQKSRQRVQEARSEMRARFSKYQEAWYSDTASLNNPTLRQAANDRLLEVRQDFEAIRPLYNDVNDGYETFIPQLQEVETYLSNDLTVPAVQAVTPTLEKTRQEAGTLRTAMDELIIGLRTLTDSLLPETSGKVDGPAN